MSNRRSTDLRHAGLEPSSCPADGHLTLRPKSPRTLLGSRYDLCQGSSSLLGLRPTIRSRSTQRSSSRWIRPTENLPAAGISGRGSGPPPGHPPWGARVETFRSSALLAEGDRSPITGAVRSLFQLGRYESFSNSILALQRTCHNVTSFRDQEDVASEPQTAEPPAT